MKAELKKQIKEDEFASSLGLAAGWLGLHAQEAKVAVVAVLVVGGAAVGISYLQEHRREAAETAFAEALRSFEAPVASEVPPGGPQPAGPTFTSAQEKYQKASSAFDAVANEYGSQPAGQRAKYYAALSRAELGLTADAEKALGELGARRDSDSIVPALSRLALAELHRRTGQAAKAVEEYQQLADDKNAGLPRDHVMMRLAATLEELKKPADALAQYRKLVAEFPQSPYAGEAQRRVSELEGAARG